MPNDTIIRKTDALGRVTLPSAFRHALGLDLGEAVALTLEGDVVHVRRVTHACAVCGATDGLSPVRDSFLCADCRNLLGERAK